MKCLGELNALSSCNFYTWSVKIVVLNDHIVYDIPDINGPILLLTILWRIILGDVSLIVTAIPRSGRIINAWSVGGRMSIST